MDRSTALTLAAVCCGLALLLGPLAVPAEAPPDRVEFRVAPVEDGAAAWTNLSYANLSTTERAAFDAARTAPDGTHNLSVAAAPPRLTPPPGGIEVYDLVHERQVYLVEVTRFTYDVDVGSQVVPRLGAMGLGVVLAAIGGYRAVA
jgi:hypothetical protein